MTRVQLIGGLAAGLALFAASRAWAAPAVVPITEFGASPAAAPAVNGEAFRKAYAALNNRGTVWVTPAAGCYRVAASIKPPYGINLEGAGYSSCIEIPPEGWPITYGGIRDYGIISINHPGHMSIRNLRIKGSIACQNEAGQEFCPAHISFNTGSNPRLVISKVFIEGNVFQDNKHNAIHPNWLTGSQQGFQIVRNTCENIGLNTPGGDAKTGFCIEATMEHSVIADNIARRVWGGVSSYGAHNVIQGNILECIASNRAPDTQYCIYSHGEGNPTGGANFISGNQITLRPKASGTVIGIRLADTAHVNLPDLVSENVILIDDTDATMNGWGVYSTATGGKLVGNQITIRKRGIGVLVDGSEKGSAIEIENTSVRVIEESGLTIGYYLRNLQKSHSLKVRASNLQAHGFGKDSLPTLWKKDVGKVEVWVDGRKQ